MISNQLISTHILFLFLQFLLCFIFDTSNMLFTRLLESTAALPAELWQWCRTTRTNENQPFSNIHKQCSACSALSRLSSVLSSQDESAVASYACARTTSHPYRLNAWRQTMALLSSDHSSGKVVVKIHRYVVTCHLNWLECRLMLGWYKKAKFF